MEKESKRGEHGLKNIFVNLCEDMKEQSVQK